MAKMIDEGDEDSTTGQARKVDPDVAINTMAARGRLDGMVTGDPVLQTTKLLDTRGVSQSESDLTGITWPTQRGRQAADQRDRRGR